MRHSKTVRTTTTDIYELTEDELEGILRAALRLGEEVDVTFQWGRGQCTSLDVIVKRREEHSEQLEDEA